MLCKRKSRPFRTRQACRTLPRVASVPPSSRCPLGSGVLTSFGLTRSLNRNAGRRSLGCNYADNSVSRRREQSPSVSLNSPRGHCTERVSRTRGVPTLSRHPRARAAPRRAGALDASMLRLSIRGNLHVCWGSERRNAKRPTRRNGRNIEFSEGPTRIVPCDAVAIGGKLLQNNGIELCAPDTCCDSPMNVLPVCLSAGIARRGLQLCCAGYLAHACTPRERTCRYCKLTDRCPTGSTRAPCTMQQSCLRHRPSPVARGGGTLSPALGTAPAGTAIRGRQVCRARDRSRSRAAPSSPRRVLSRRASRKSSFIIPRKPR